MFINEVRKLIQEAHQMRMAQAQRELEAKVEWDKQESVQSQHLWEKLKSDIKKAVLENKYQVYVGKLDIYHNCYITKKILEQISYRPPRYLEAKDLIGRYKYLYQKCEDEGLKPVVSWTYDDGGINSWYEFHVKW